jgi:iron complex transport system permease protein
VWLAAALVLAFVFSLLLGRYPGLLLWPGRLAEDEMARRLLLNVRLPRLLCALMLGMSLAAAGTVFQMLFGNPLVEPGFLGVSQGAAFGAGLGIVLLGGSPWVVQAAAAVCAFAGLGLSLLLARRARFGGWVLRLVLAGIAASALFSAGVGMLKYAADPLRQLPELTFWLLGSLSAATWVQARSIAPLVTAGLLVMLLMRWRLNLLALDDVTAFSLGASPGRERALLLVAAVAATATVVSVAGIVGWVGLIVPHIARRLFGADASRSLPGAMLLGGLAAVLCDDVARAALPGEIPLGVLTSLVGALAFVVVARSRGLQAER